MQYSRSYIEGGWLGKNQPGCFYSAVSYGSFYCIKKISILIEQSDNMETDMNWAYL